MSPLISSLSVLNTLLVIAGISEVQLLDTFLHPVELILELAERICYPFAIDRENIDVENT